MADCQTGPLGSVEEQCMKTLDAAKTMPAASRPRKLKGSGLSYLKGNWILYAMLAMPLLYFFVFRYLPMIGILVAFKDYNVFSGIVASPWSGLKSFREIFAMQEFPRAVRNTFVLNALDLVVGFPAPIILAIMLNELRFRKLKRVSQTLLYLPHFLSWVIIGGLFLQLFSAEYGLVNNLIVKMGGQPIHFLTEKLNWIVTYTILGVWQGVGWNTIIYLASISGVSAELYEAAVVDGAGRFRKIWHITLPGIKPTIIILLILNIGRIVTIGFDRPFILGNNLIIEVSDVISTFVYRVGIQSFRYSIATAVGLFQSVIGMVFLLAANAIANRVGEQGIW